MPPKAVENLNVGAPGQLGPNMNDPRTSLRESVRSAPELVDLVKSAADDLGVDLDQRPTSQDDVRFEEAPVQRSPQRSSISQHSTTLNPVIERLEEDTQDTEDAWLRHTRRQLTELSETRSQLMDELDAIAEDLGVRIDERHLSSASIDPVQRVLSKMSTSLSRKSARLRNKSVDSAVDEIPRMIDQEINERRLSGALTRISTQSRRMSMISAGMVEVEAIPPEEIQEWLECAQSELPAAIDSITAVLETLPAIERERDPEVEEVEEQIEDEEGFQYNEDLEQERLHHEDTVNDAQRRRSRAYTEPILQLQDRVADLERKLRKESVQHRLDEYSEEEDDDDDEEVEEASSPVERAIVEPVDFQAPVMRIADEEPPEEQEPMFIQRVASGQNTPPPHSRRSTQAAYQDVESLSPVSWEQVEETPLEQPIEEEIETPLNERVASRHMTSLSARRRSTQSERTHSLPVELYEDEDFTPLNLQQKIVGVEPEPGILSRRTTRRKSSVTPDLRLGPISPVPTRKPTNISSHRSTVGELAPTTDDFQPPIMRKATGLESKERPELGIVSHVSTQKSTIIPSRRTTIQEPELEGVKLASPVARKATELDPEDNLETYAVSRVSTGRSMMIPSRKSTLQEFDAGIDKEFHPPIIRQATGSDLEHRAELDTISRVTTRKSTTIPSKRSTMRELERQPTFSYEEPITELEPEDEHAFQPPVMRKATGFDQELEPETLSRVSTRKSSTVSSRRPTAHELERQQTFTYEESISDHEPEANESFQRPIVRKATGFEETESEIEDESLQFRDSRQATRRPTRRDSELSALQPDVEDADREAPVLRNRRSSIKSVRSPSPILEEAPEEAIIWRHSIRQLTRGATITSQAPLTEEVQPPVMRLARSATQLPDPSPIDESEEPFVHSRPLTRQTTIKDTSDIPEETPPTFQSRTVTRSMTLTNAALEASGGFEPSDNSSSGKRPSLAPVLRKATTRRSTKRISSPEPISREATARRPTERIPSPQSDFVVEDESPSSEPVLRSINTRSTTDRLPSPTPIIRKVTTRRLTDKVISHEHEPYNEESPSLEPVLHKAATRLPSERFPSPESVIVKATSWRPTERLPSPEPMSRRVTARKPTERLPSPDAIIRKATTRRRTEPLAEPPAPPSSPSSFSDAVSPSRKATLLKEAPEGGQQLPVMRMTDALSRVSTRQETLQRQPTQREETRSPDSFPSSANNPPPAHEKASQKPTSPVVEEGTDFEPPVMRMRQGTTVYVPESERPEQVIERQSTGASPRSSFFRRQSTVPIAVERVVSRQPTKISRAPTTTDRALNDLPPVSKRRATLERTLTLVPRQATLVPEALLPISRVTTRQSTKTDWEPPVVRRATGEVTHPPTRRSTEANDDTVPISRQLTRRRSDFEEATGLKRLPTSQPTKRRTEPLLEPSQQDEPELGAIQRDVQGEASSHEEDNVHERQPTRQHTAISRKTTRAPTENFEEPELERRSTTVSKKPTHAPTEIIDGSELGRHPTRRLILPLEETKVKGEYPTVFAQRNAHEQSPAREEEPFRERQATRRPTTVSREATRPPTKPNEEPELERQITRQPTLLTVPNQPIDSPPFGPSGTDDEESIVPAPPDRQQSRVSKRPSEFERQPTLPQEIGELEVDPIIRKRTTRQRTEQFEERPSFNGPVIRVLTRSATRRGTVPFILPDADSPALSRKPTEGDEVNGSDSSSLYSHPATSREDIIHRQKTIQVNSDQGAPRRATTLRTATGLTGLTTSSSEPPEFASLEQMQNRAASRKPTLEKAPRNTDFTPPVIRAAVPSRQATQLEEESEISESEDAPADAELPGSIGRRQSVIERLSNEAVKDEPIDDKESDTDSDEQSLRIVEQQASPISRKSTTASRAPARQPTIPSRKPTEHKGPSPPNSPYTDPSPKIFRKVSREPTRLSRQPKARESSSPLPLSRQPTAPARRTTTTDESPSSILAVTQMDRADTESGVQDESDFEVSESEISASSPNASMQVSRKSTGASTSLVSRKPTQSFESTSTASAEAPVIERALTHRPTDFVRNVTRVPTTQAPYEEEAALLRRASTRSSRQPTKTQMLSGLVEENAETESKVARTPSQSTQSSILDEPLAALDVYHARPAPATTELILQGVVPREPSSAIKRTDTMRSRNQSTVEDALPEQKVVRIQDEPTAAYSPLTPTVSSRQSGFSTLERQPTASVNEAQPAQDDIVAAPVSRVVERQPTLSAEEIPEQEPGRLDRPPTANLSRDPESLAPSVQYPNISKFLNEPERRQSTMPSVLTVPVEEQRKPSLAALGIVTPPVQYIPKQTKPTRSNNLKHPGTQFEILRRGPSHIPTHLLSSLTRDHLRKSSEAFLDSGANPSPTSRRLSHRGTEVRSVPFDPRHQDLLGERYKGQQVFQLLKESPSSLPAEYRLPSPTTSLLLEETTLLPDLRQPSLGRTTTTLGSRLHFPSDEIHILDRKQHLFDEISTHSLRPFQSEEIAIQDLHRPLYEEMSIHNLPQHPLDKTSTRDLFQFDTILHRQLTGNPLPGRSTPLATKLMRDPFVSRRRNPLALNLRRSKTLVTKRRPLLGMKRLHLFVGRRLTRNPLARRHFKKRRLSQKVSSEMLNEARKKSYRRTRKQPGEGQKRSLRMFRQRKAEIFETKITKSRKFPWLLPKGRRKRAQSNNAEAQREIASKGTKNRKQKGARKQISDLPPLMSVVKPETIVLPVAKAWTVPAERVAEDHPSTRLIPNEVSAPELAFRARAPSQLSRPQEGYLQRVRSSARLETSPGLVVHNTLKNPSPPMRQPGKYRLRDRSSTENRLRAQRAFDRGRHRRERDLQEQEVQEQEFPVRSRGEGRSRKRRMGSRERVLDERQEVGDRQLHSTQDHQMAYRTQGRGHQEGRVFLLDQRESSQERRSLPRDPEPLPARPPRQRSPQSRAYQETEQYQRQRSPHERETRQRSRESLDRGRDRSRRQRQHQRQYSTEEQSHEKRPRQTTRALAVVPRALSPPQQHQLRREQRKLQDNPQRNRSLLAPSEETPFSQERHQMEQEGVHTGQEKMEMDGKRTEQREQPINRDRRELLGGSERRLFRDRG
ncbi:hypothetical protein N0V90_013142 [Kalmusia sp. IMI 367209]|nr:hypothetical protein N0V90_013142 [Kalmusia sp. IMI 367209]